MDEKNNSEMDKTVTALGKLVKYLKCLNPWETVKVLVTLVFVAFVIVFIRKPEVVVQWTHQFAEARRVEAERTESERVRQRLDADENIRGILTGLLESTGADRAWLFEPHNGSSNLSSGLPFLFADLTMDLPADGVFPLNTGNYTNLRLSNYPFIAQLIKEGFWYGDVDTLKGDDSKFYHKLAGDNTQKIAALMLWKGRDPLGCIGLSWHSDTSPDWRLVGRRIRECSAQVSMELLMLQY